MNTKKSIIITIALSVLAIFACSEPDSSSEGTSFTQNNETTEPSVVKPAAPTGVRITGVKTTDGANITVSWNSVSGATSYGVYWSATIGGASPSTWARVGTVSGTTYNSTYINGSYYHYRVTAINSAGESDPSSYVTLHQ
jgi:pectate lyase